MVGLFVFDLPFIQAIECHITYTPHCAMHFPDKVTTVKNKYYPTSVYNKFTIAKKAKHWQLRNPGKTPGTGPSGRKTKNSSATVAVLTSAVTTVSAAALAISELTATTTK
jgi:hypothetical protein